MADRTDEQAAQGALRYILLATVIAGAIGYLIQFAVPIFAPDSYLTFATTWSAIYLVVTCVSGIQQEITRAARPDPSGAGYPTWLTFTISAAAVVAVGVSAVFALIGPRVFPSDTVAFVLILALASGGYALVAALSGALYGLGAWPAVAGMTVSDSAVRLLTIAGALLAGAGATKLGWAIAMPFAVAVAGMWLWTGRRVKMGLGLDVGIGRLARNSVATVLASLATGALISGLPLLINAFASDAGSELLAVLILAITLTRAPLVVPLLALQGYLVVSFRDRADRIASMIVRWVILVLALVVVLALLAALIGPALLSAVFPSFSSLPAADLALIVVSAGLTGVMCITGPAVLAGNRHTWYTAGWAVSALATLVILMLPFDAHSRILTALLVGPVMGSAVHMTAVRRARRQGE